MDTEIERTSVYMQARTVTEILDFSLPPADVSPLQITGSSQLPFSILLFIVWCIFRFNHTSSQPSFCSFSRLIHCLDQFSCVLSIHLNATLPTNLFMFAYTSCTRTLSKKAYPLKTLWQFSLGHRTNNLFKRHKIFWDTNYVHTVDTSRTTSLKAVFICLVWIRVFFIEYTLLKIIRILKSCHSYVIVSNKTVLIFYCSYWQCCSSARCMGRSFHIMFPYFPFLELKNWVWV